MSWSTQAKKTSNETKTKAAAGRLARAERARSQATTDKPASATSWKGERVDEDPHRGDEHDAEENGSHDLQHADHPPGPLFRVELTQNRDPRHEGRIGREILELERDGPREIRKKVVHQNARHPSSNRLRHTEDAKGQLGDLLPAEAKDQQVIERDGAEDDRQYGVGHQGPSIHPFDLLGRAQLPLALDSSRPVIVVCDLHDQFDRISARPERNDPGTRPRNRRLPRRADLTPPGALDPIDIDAARTQDICQLKRQGGMRSAGGNRIFRR